VDPDGTISSYNWFFGDGQSKRGRHLSHAFRHDGVYHVVLRTTDSSGNYAYTERPITVSRLLSSSR
jgi:PKD repeat protein